MKITKRIIVVFCLGLFVFNCQVNTVTAENKSAALATEKDKISYIIGTKMAASLLNIKGEINVDMLKKGLEDQMTEKPLMIPEDEANTLLQSFSQRMQAKQMEERKVKGEANLAAGKAFLEKNAKKEGVTTTASGLQYMVVTKGTGPIPAASDTVKVNYEGTTIDGKVFDSSYKRNEPATFPVANVIPGWTEALQLMPVGSKYKLFIPTELAYGPQGMGQQIEPNATLVFDVELLEIVKQEKKAPVDLVNPKEKAEKAKPATETKK
ncbi:MAG: FKBP-type peptidyl-prolyl cis-trans isomerase [Thermodesulfobacteriota bacterium]